MSASPAPGHLGDRLAALVDGQLGHAERDRVLAHLARCAGCRAEAAAQRALKARLDHLDVPPPGGLQARLLGLAGPRVPLPGVPPPPPGWSPPTRPASPAAPVPSAAPEAHRRRRPPLTVTATLLLIGAGIGLAALADPAQPQRNPGLEVLLVEHGTTATRVPLADPATVGVSWSPVTTASATAGGAGASGG